MIVRIPLRHVLALLTASTAPSSAPLAPQSPCAARTQAATIDVYVAIQRRSPSDTIMQATVCLASAGTPAIGSYSIALLYDETVARNVRVVSAAGGTRAENAARAGVVSLAGASTTGFAWGALATVTMRVPRNRTPSLRLRVVELAGLDHRDLRAKLAFVAVPGSPGEAPAGPLSQATTPASACRSTNGSPRLVRLSPDEAGISAIRMGEPVFVEIQGCGFAATGNTIRFGTEEIRDVASLSGGTRLRFVLPDRMRSGAEVAPMPVQQGTYAVVVTTAGRTSNILNFTIE
jgi:hypothetical protein